MRTRSILCHSLIAASALTLTQVPFAEPAHADAFGADLPILISILAESISTVADLVDMVTTMKQQLDAMNTMLKRVESASYDPVRALLDPSSANLRRLAGDLRTIGYTLEEVDGQYQTVYRSDYSGVGFNEFDAIYGRWNDEVLASAQIAARSQASLSALEDIAAKAAAILASSGASDGEVAQLQAIVQELGVMISQNNTLIQELATTGRVLSASAAQNASEGQLAREKKNRALAGYRDRGGDAPPMTKLP